MNDRYLIVRNLLVIMLICVCTVNISFAQEKGTSPPLPEIDISAEDALGFLQTDAGALYKAARQAHGDQDFETAAKYYIAMLQMDSSNQDALYNLACCYSMQNDAVRASECLLAAADAGFANLWSLDHDPEFDPVKESEEYKAALDSIKAQLEEKELAQGEMVFVKAPTYLQCRVQFPDDYDPRKEYTLVVGLHGYGHHPNGFTKLWKRFAEHDFIFAVPQAPYAFNSGSDEPGFSWGLWTDTHGLPANSWNTSVDYLAETIDQLQNLYPVNETYVLGFSQGAAMSYFIGMEHPQMLSGIIPFGGWLDVDWLGESVITDAKKQPASVHCTWQQ